MESVLSEYLQSILDDVKDQDGGHRADYIPDLADANPDVLGLALCTASGHLYTAGDVDTEFSIQSISKPFAYAQALDELGIQAVLDVVGMEPSGEAFNDLSLDEKTHKPVNPMINAGAITVHQLICGDESSVEKRVAHVRQFFSKLAGRGLRVNKELVESEMSAADRNLAIAHMLRNYGIFDTPASDAVRSYTNQCSIMVTVKDLAVMAATLANGGVQPVTNEKVIEPLIARQALSVMTSAGMYDAAGRWMATVGIPAKSGVAGGLIGVMPGQYGIASMSPRLDEQGNSVRGVKIFQELSDNLGMHLMTTQRFGPPTVRRIFNVHNRTVVSLQGGIDFDAAEQFLYTLANHDFGNSKNIVLDLSRVQAYNDVGNRTMQAGVQQLQDAGYKVFFFDPKERAKNTKFGTRPDMVNDVPDDISEN